MDNIGYNMFDAWQILLPKNKFAEKENNHEICM